MSVAVRHACTTALLTWSSFSNTHGCVGRLFLLWPPRCSAVACAVVEVVTVDVWDGLVDVAMLRLLWQQQDMVVQVLGDRCRGS
jgi:hypothetical protein